MSISIICIYNIIEANFIRRKQASNAIDKATGIRVALLQKTLIIDGIGKIFGDLQQFEKKKRNS